MAKWKKSSMKLKDNHGWRCSPGHQICVIGRGLMQFEYPVHWIVKPTDTSLKLHDRVPPLDDIVMEISVLPMRPIRWKDVVLSKLLQDNLIQSVEEIKLDDEIISYNRDGIEMVWAEYRRIETDPKDDSLREATWRSAMAHEGDTVVVITYGFWSEFYDKAASVWNHFLDTIIMNRMVDDPTQGPKLH